LKKPRLLKDEDRKLEFLGTDEEVALYHMRKRMADTPPFDCSKFTSVLA
jgi:hypothetical protein